MLFADITLLSAQSVEKYEVEHNYKPGDHEQQPGKPVLPVANCTGFLQVRIQVRLFSGFFIALPVQLSALRLLLFFIQINTFLYALGDEFRLLPGLSRPLRAASDFQGLVAGFGGWLRVLGIPAHNIGIKYRTIYLSG